jgi:hypothetical protein
MSEPPKISLGGAVHRDVKRAIQAILDHLRGQTISREDANNLINAAVAGVNTGTINDLTVPDQPQNLTVTGAFSTIILDWDSSSASNYAYTEIWRIAAWNDTSTYQIGDVVYYVTDGRVYEAVASSQNEIPTGNPSFWTDLGTDVIGNTTLVGTTIANVFTDNPPDSSTAVTYYYWIRFVSTAGILGPFDTTAGTPGSTSTDPTYALEVLTEELGYDQFDLSTGIFPVRIVDVLPTLPDTDWPAGSMAYLTTDGLLYKTEDGTVDSWVPVVNTTDLSGTIDVTQFASGIEPVSIVSFTPGSPPATETTSTIFNTTDGKLYRWDGAQYIATIPTSDLSGYVQAAQIEANSITAGQIAAGAIGADEIAANAITTDKIRIGDVTNLVADPRFEFQDWYLSGAGAEIDTGFSLYGSNSGKVTWITGTDSYVLQDFNNLIPVDEGEELYLGFSYYFTEGTAGDQFRAIVLFYTDDPFYVSQTPIVISSPTTGAWTLYQTTFTVPTGTNIERARIEIGIQAADATSGAVLNFDNVVVRRIVGTTIIQDGAITTDKVTAQAITADQIATNAITSGKIEAGAVIADKLATSNLITLSAQIVNGVITTGKIDDLAVTTGKIDDLAVTEGKIANLNVTTAKIAEGNITTLTIDEEAVTVTRVTDLNGTGPYEGAGGTGFWYNDDTNFDYYDEVTYTIPHAISYVILAQIVLTGALDATDLFGLRLQKDNGGTPTTVFETNATGAAAIFPLSFINTNTDLTVDDWTFTWYFYCSGWATAGGLRGVGEIEMALFGGAR